MKDERSREPVTRNSRQVQDAFIVLVSDDKTSFLFLAIENYFENTIASPVASGYTITNSEKECSVEIHDAKLFPDLLIPFASMKIYMAKSKFHLWFHQKHQKARFSKRLQKNNVFQLFELTINFHFYFCWEQKKV